MFVFCRLDVQSSDDEEAVEGAFFFYPVYCKGGDYYGQRAVGRQQFLAA